MERAFYGAIGIVILFTLFFWYMVAHTLYDMQIETQSAFVSDDCTLFFAGNWAECCVAHDRSYWQGGSAELRSRSDDTFRSCIQDRSDNALMATSAYWIARVGGVPYIATPWRWGYGWSFGRGYR